MYNFGIRIKKLFLKHINNLCLAVERVIGELLEFDGFVLCVSVQKQKTDYIDCMLGF